MFLQEDRRLAILRLLESQQGYVLNDSVVHDGLRQLGHRCSRDQVRSEFAWLTQQGLVSVEELDIDVHVATLTSQGQSVALGEATCPGVKRPSAG